MRTPRHPNTGYRRCDPFFLAPLLVLAVMPLCEGCRSPQLAVRQTPAEEITQRSYRVDSEGLLNSIFPFGSSSLVEASMGPMLYSGPDPVPAATPDPASSSRPVFLTPPAGPNLEPSIPSIRTFLRAHGLPWNPPSDLFYNPRNGLLLLKAGTNDIALAERLLGLAGDHPVAATMPADRPIELEVQFAEIPVDSRTRSLLGFVGFDSSRDASVRATAKPMRGSLSGLGIDERVRREFGRPKPAAPTFTRVLSGRDPERFLRRLRGASGVSIMELPIVKMRSGGEAETRAIDSRDITMSVAFPMPSGTARAPVTDPLEFGDILDAAARFAPGLAQGTLELTLLARSQEFLAHDGTADGLHPESVPLFRLRQALVNISLESGDMVVLGLGSSEATPIAGRRTLVVIVRPRVSASRISAHRES